MFLYQYEQVFFVSGLGVIALALCLQSQIVAIGLYIGLGQIYAYLANERGILDRCLAREDAELLERSRDRFDRSKDTLLSLDPEIDIEAWVKKSFDFARNIFKVKLWIYTSFIYPKAILSSLLGNPLD